jgi:uncharacterized protein YkwD
VKRVTLLVGIVLALAGTLAGSAGAADGAPAAPQRLQALDKEILARLNATRVAHGLRPLRLSRELQEAAVYQSRTMLEGGFFDHTSRDGSPFDVRLKRFYRAGGYRIWSAGENLLYNTVAISADEAIQAWLDSPHHRQNMLDPDWREVGIGTVHTASAGGTFGGKAAFVITMDFGAREAFVDAKLKSAVSAKPKPKKPASTTIAAKTGKA